MCRMKKGQNDQERSSVLEKGFLEQTMNCAVRMIGRFLL